MPHKNLRIAASCALLAGLLLQSARAQEPQEERWNAFGQATYIWHRQQAFPAAYT